jgi:hypothetical protein
MQAKTVDTDAARELDLYAENTYELYGQFNAIIANLKRKIAKGTYRPALAPKLWRYWYDAAAQRYCKEYGGSVRSMFPVAVRQYAAEQRAQEEYDAMIRGEYEEVA